MIQLENIHIGYQQSLLEIPSMELQAGSVYTLIGRNGSGKSTFLKTLSRQIDPLSGKIFIHDKDLSELSKTELPTLLSFVPAHFPLMDFVTAQEYIGLGRSPYTGMLGKMKDADLEQVQKALQLLSIEHLSQKPTTQLSDGEKQMVAIAKSIAQEADCIVLDEPTAFLDYANKVNVMEILHNVARSMNKCIILSSHDIDLCVEMKGQFLVLESNKKQLTQLENAPKAALIQRAFNTPAR